MLVKGGTGSQPQANHKPCYQIILTNMDINMGFTWWFGPDQQLQTKNFIWMDMFVSISASPIQEYRRTICNK